MIYLDYAATTRVRPEAAKAAYDAMLEGYGNPSSRYELGRSAAARREEDRKTVAKALGCQPNEVIFTSCGTESDNWAIRAAVELNRRKGKHIITTAIEHSAVLEPIKELAKQGYEVTYLQPNAAGTIEIDDLKAALRPDTILVSMMLVNNEIGSILPVAEAVKAVRRSGAPALFHTDAVQAFMKVPFTCKSLGVDLLSISGHKIGAPKGIGAMYVKNGLKIRPLMLGGGQEGGLRPGTEPTSQIAALAEACRLGLAERGETVAHMRDLKEYTLRRVQEVLPMVEQVGSGEAPHILCLTLPGYKSEVLVRVLADQGICVSAGSACHRGKPSHVFAAMPMGKPAMEGSFRVSFGKDTTTEEIDALVDALAKAKETLFPSMS